jgi:pyrroline-5-carboxylate reductase
MSQETIAIIGGGNMAEAIIKGLLSGGVAPQFITVAEVEHARRAYLQQQFSLTVAESSLTLLPAASIVILAVKPQVADTVLRGMAAAPMTNKLVISIMAGVRAATIEESLPKGCRVVRAMPNTPALVLAGATAISAGINATDEDLARAKTIFDRIGKTLIVDEKLMDAVTALSGSGPAYVFTFIEALSDAGVKNGLPRAVATELAIQTVLGSAQLLRESGEHPALLRDKVTSPGGTTIAGLAALECEGFRSAVIAAVDAATLRAKELGGEKR